MALDLSMLLKAAGESAYEPVSTATIIEAQRQLQFELPPLLGKIYSEMGDGGFGPGYGFYGLLEGTDEYLDESVVGLYTSFREPDLEDQEWSWPEKLLPLVDWGCAIRSCIDCSDETLPVIRFDPNSGASAMFNSEGYTFEQWLAAWLDGKNLW